MAKTTVQIQRKNPINFLKSVQNKFHQDYN
jgi:hypothetical protein